MFLGKGVLKICSKFTGKHPTPKCDSNKVALQLYWNRTLAWVFCCKFAAYIQNTFSQEHLSRAACYVSYTMITYPFCSNSSKKIFFSTMFSALQYSFLHYEFSWWFLVYFIWTENEIKKGKYSNEIRIFTFLWEQMNDLFDVKHV